MQRVRPKNAAGQRAERSKGRGRELDGVHRTSVLRWSLVALRSEVVGAADEVAAPVGVRVRATGRTGTPRTQEMSPRPAKRSFPNGGRSSHYNPPLALVRSEFTF